LRIFGNKEIWVRIRDKSKEWSDFIESEDSFEVKSLRLIASTIFK